MISHALYYAHYMTNDEDIRYNDDHITFLLVCYVMNAILYPSYDRDRVASSYAYNIISISIVFVVEPMII